ncbi:MFS transporter [Alcaligenes faecalis]|uniref:MFS transporter n=1 Tax=Alcaligenes faecalis TaxID=511 RepID=UPI0018EF0F5B|nr:MFS transporter [Alcaligenes faecalis]
MANTQEASWSELLSGRNGLRSLALAGGVAVHAINVYVATTILPSVVEDIGGLEYYAWNTTLFVVASILGSALSPQVLEKLGLRHSFLVSLLFFAIGTTLCAAAPSMPFLLFARTIQGLGGGLLLGLSYSSIRLVFEERLWPRVMALVSSMWGVATLSGPAIGGVFAQMGQWRLAFWSVLPCAALLAILVWTQLRDARAPESRKSGSTLGKVLLLTASVLAMSAGSLSTSWMINLAGVAGGAILVYLMARADSKSTSRLFPQGTYSISTALGSLYAGIGLVSVAVATEIFIPYFLQIIHHMSPLKAGYLTALMSGGWTLGSIASSSRGLKTGDRMIIAGPVLSGLSLVALGVFIPWEGLSEGTDYSWALYLSLLGVGVGIGLAWPHLLTRVFHSAPKGQENIASAAITTLQLFTMALGAALAGIITTASGFVDPGGVQGARQSAQALLWLFALAPLLAAFLSGPARRVRPKA